MGWINEAVAKPKRGFLASILLKSLAENALWKWRKTAIIPGIPKAEVARQPAVIRGFSPILSSDSHSAASLARDSMW
jgi:hypothetical protein